jgi:hypothetical protein
VAIANERITNASQPKIAFFRCRALQRPTRWAKLIDCGSGASGLGALDGMGVTLVALVAAVATLARAIVCGRRRPSGLGFGFLSDFEDANHERR